MRIGAPLTVATVEIVERARRDDAPHSAQDFFLSAAGDVAAGDIGVLAPDGVAHGGDRNLIGRQAIGVDPDIDRPVQVADQREPRRPPPNARAEL